MMSVLADQQRTDTDDRGEPVEQPSPSNPAAPRGVTREQIEAVHCLAAPLNGYDAVIREAASGGEHTEYWRGAYYSFMAALALDRGDQALIALYAVMAKKPGASRGRRALARVVSTPKWIAHQIAALAGAVR